MSYRQQVAAFYAFFIMMAAIAPSAFADLTGLWRFDDPNNLGLATVGTDLTLTGNSTAVTGINPGDGAAIVGDNSYYTVSHGMAPNGGVFVNQYTMLMDISYPSSSAGKWLSLYQTNTGNSNDGDLFIRNSDQAIGLAGLGGYSSNTTAPDTWYRVILTVNNGVDRSVYVNGTQWLDGNAGSIDDRHSLDPAFLLFADENGDEDPIQISNLAVWNEALDQGTIAGLGGPNPGGVDIPAIGPLTLRVDGDSGTASIRNLSGEDVSFISYSIRSSGGNLDGGNAAWQSFADQGIPGWSETSVADDYLAEMSSAEAFSLSDGQQVSLGSPFSFQPSRFGEDPADDVRFAYRVGNVGEVDGMVDYTGPANTLVLSVDPVSGEGMIQNTSSFGVDINGYAVRSDDGSLRPLVWSSLQDRTIGAWDEANPTDRHLSELNPSGSLRWNPNVAIRLGQLFDTEGTRDLRLEFQRATDGQQFDGVVRYETVSPDVAGDFNADGTLDELDIDMLSLEVIQRSDNALFDLTMDGLVNQADRDEWVVNLKGTMFGDANLDFVVDDTDFAILSGNLFQAATSWSAADFTGDGVTDGSDFNVWNNNRGFNGVAAAVPEPGRLSIWLLILFVLQRRVSAKIANMLDFS